MKREEIQKIVEEAIRSTYCVAPKTLGKIAKQANLSIFYVTTATMRRDWYPEGGVGYMRLWAEEPINIRGHFDVGMQSDKILVDSYQSATALYKEVIENLSKEFKLVEIKEFESEPSSSSTSSISKLYKFQNKY